MANTSTYVNGSIKKTSGTDVEYRFPRTALNNIVVSPTSATTLITSNGKIKPAYLTSANATAAGVVYNNDSEHLSITNGGISINTYGANLVSATSADDLKKIAIVSSVKDYVSTYTHTSDNIPTSAINGLGGIVGTVAELQEDGWVKGIVGGAGVSVTSSFQEYTVSLPDYQNIIVPSATVTTITLAPGNAYKIDATTGSKTLAINSFDEGKWGRESHIELFVANTGYIKTGANVIFAEPLEPDSVNNCTVRFHDGKAIISVEDHIAGYIVVSTGSASGSLPYGLASATSTYLAFNDSLAGQVLTMGGVTTNKEKHIVGNGYEDTILTGGVVCTSKTTFANLTMSSVVNSGGTMTLGDVFIPRSATVSVSGGSLVIEKVTGDEGTIDLVGKHISLAGTTLSAAGIMITGGYFSGVGGAFSTIGSSVLFNIDSCVFKGNSAGTVGSPGYGAAFANVHNLSIFNLSNCVITSNYATARGGGVYTSRAAETNFFNCVISGNSNLDISNEGSAITNLTGCTVGEIRMLGGSVTLNGRNKIDSAWGNNGKFIISSGAIVDLTENTNATPIAPGGGIKFESGGATVLYSSGAVSGSYMLDNVDLPAGAKLTNTAVVDLGGTNIVVPNGGVANASGVAFSGGNGGNSGGAFLIKRAATLNLSGATVTNCSATYGAAIYADGSGTITLSNTTITNNTGYGAITLGTTLGITLNITSSVLAGNPASQDIRVLVSHTINIEDSTVGIIYGSAGKINLAGSNTIASIKGLSATVMLSSGASINLTSSIAPGGSIEVKDICYVNGGTVEGGIYSFISSGANGPIVD